MESKERESCRVCLGLHHRVRKKPWPGTRENQSATHHRIFEIIARISPGSSMGNPFTLLRFSTPAISSPPWNQSVRYSIAALAGNLSHDQDRFPSIIIIILADPHHIQGPRGYPARAAQSFRIVEILPSQRDVFLLFGPGGGHHPQWIWRSCNGHCIFAIGIVESEKNHAGNGPKLKHESIHTPLDEVTQPHSSAYFMRSMSFLIPSLCMALTFWVLMVFLLLFNLAAISSTRSPAA